MIENPNAKSFSTTSVYLMTAPISNPTERSIRTGRVKNKRKRRRQPETNQEVPATTLDNKANKGGNTGTSPPNPLLMKDSVEE